MDEPSVPVRHFLCKQPGKEVPMRTKDFDPNREFAELEKACKGRSRILEVFLPVSRPPWHKRRVADLLARHKYFPAGFRKHRFCPELGKGIVFISFTRGLLGKYDKLTSKEEKEFFAKMINEKAPKRRK
jgi:hypothetical protein